MERERGAIFIVSGPSGVGKTTVVTNFLRQCSKDYQICRVVTYTTKIPRVTVVDGVDYHFITQSEFERKVEDGFFLEWSGEYGACYGTPAYILERVVEGQSYILVIDRVGAAQVIQQYPGAILIWIQVSSINMLSERLKSRKTDSFEQIQTRLFLARKEIEQELHAPMYHYHIANDELKVAVQSVSELILPHCMLAKKDII